MTSLFLSWEWACPSLRPWACSWGATTRSQGFLWLRTDRRPRGWMVPTWGRGSAGVFTQCQSRNRSAQSRWAQPCPTAGWSHPDGTGLTWTGHEQPLVPPQISLAAPWPRLPLPSRAIPGHRPKVSSGDTPGSSAPSFTPVTCCSPPSPGQAAVPAPLSPPRAHSPSKFRVLEEITIDWVVCKQQPFISHSSGGWKILDRGAGRFRRSQGSLWGLI